MDVGKKVALRPCKRCGALSPKPLSRDGTHRVPEWPPHARGFLCDNCRAIPPGDRILERPCKRCGVLSPKPLRRDGEGRVKNWPHPSQGFLCDACQAKHNKGESHPRWRGGRSLDSTRGYVRVYVGPGRRDLEHRVVWTQTYGPIPPGLHLHHLNGEKTDNRLENLALVTNRGHQALHREKRAANPRWAVGHACCRTCGTTERRHHAHGMCQRCYEEAGARARGVRPLETVRGEQHPLAKLTADGVRLIRSASAAGRSGASIARELGVNPRTVQHVLAGRHWSHVV